MGDHAGRDQQDQDRAGEGIVDEAGCRQRVDRVRRSVESSPASADQTAGEYFVGLAAFEQNAGGKQHEAYHHGTNGSSGGAHVGSVVCEERHDADYQEESPQLVQNVAADQRLPLLAAARLARGFGYGRRR